MAAVLMLLSSIIFTSIGEPTDRTDRGDAGSTLFSYLRDGFQVMRSDRNFRLFVYAQWSGGAVLMAMPFYVVQAGELGIGFDHVALLLASQTAGALASNLPWGWWGDR